MEAKGRKPSPARRRVVLAGGATGGHLYPAIALAEELQASGRGDPFFLCTDRPFDRRELEAAGFPFVALPSAGMSLRTLGRIPRAIVQAVRRASEILDAVRPERVVGFGGHGSVAPLLAAGIKGIPISLFEQNSIPGKATRLFAPWADHVLLQWPHSARYFGGCRARVRITGSPVRRALRPVPRDAARAWWGVGADRVVLTILGGSQAARGLNVAILSSLGGLRETGDRVHVLHVTGDADFLAAHRAYSESGICATVIPYCRTMGALYSASDLVICRAGAMTLQELSIFRLPAVLVPLPNAAGAHQLHNARILAGAGACRWIRQEEIRPGFLRDLVLTYLRRKSRFRALGERLRAAFGHRAAGEFLRDLDLI